MSGEEILLQGDVRDVAEMAVEPSYISEIARKLQQVDSQWGSLTFLTAVNTVGRAVRALERDNRVQVQSPEYGTFGGQKESSAKLSLSGAGQEQTEEWKTYTLVRSKTPFGSVREEYQSVVDPSVTMSDKLEIIDNVSRMGNVMSRQVEEILFDQATADLDDAEELITTDYNDPGVDMFAVYDDKVVAYEISTRWVNPIDKAYMTAKINKALDAESEFDKPVDLVVMAPRFTQTVQNRYNDDSIVSLQRLPRAGDGFPIVSVDDNSTIDQLSTSGLVGPGYPVVLDDNLVFRDDVEGLLRNANFIRESRYRSQITTIFGIVS